MAPKGGHIVISVSVCSSVRPSVLPSFRPFVTDYFCWRVVCVRVVCVRFSSETTRPISLMMIPIYRVNNVDLQHIHHFDHHPSMTAGQGHKILQFCEFRLLPWHECWYMSGPYKVAGDRLDLVIHCFSLLYICLQCDEVFMTLLVPLDSTYASTGPPKKNSSDYFHILLYLDTKKRLYLYRIDSFRKKGPLIRGHFRQKKTARNSEMFVRPSIHPSVRPSRLRGGGV